MTDQPVHLTPGGPPETDPRPRAGRGLAALDDALARPVEEQRAAVAAVVARWPRFLDGWAQLGLLGRDDVECYAYHRVGYHRGLDRLRASGWRGSGYVRWRHERTGASCGPSTACGRRPTPSASTTRPSAAPSSSASSGGLAVDAGRGAGGRGKTSLVAGWAAEATLPTAWLSLDDHDRDAAHVWRGVIAAARDPRTGLRPAGADRAARGLDTITHAVAVLLDDLVDQPSARSVLVVDDLHVADDDDVFGESLTMFVAHLPEWLRIVAASRRDLPLPLDRLRARGQVREIRFAELRFAATRPASCCRNSPRRCPTTRSTSPSSTPTGGPPACSSPRSAPGTATGDRQAATTTDDAHLVHDYVLHEVLVGEEREMVEAMREPRGRRPGEPEPGPGLDGPARCRGGVAARGGARASS